MGMLPILPSLPSPSKKFGHSVFSWRQAHSVIALGYFTLQTLSRSLYLCDGDHILESKIRFLRKETVQEEQNQV